MFQIFDTGSLEGPHGSFEVCNVQVFGGFVLHIGFFTNGIGRFSVRDKVTCKVAFHFNVFLLGCASLPVSFVINLFLFQVDYKRRQLIAPNHTCTHMLNFALRVGNNLGGRTFFAHIYLWFV